MDLDFQCGDDHYKLVRGFCRHKMILKWDATKNEWCVYHRFHRRASDTQVSTFIKNNFKGSQ